MREWETNPNLLVAPIIDIGSGKLPLNIPGLKVDTWDKEQGDATYMAGVPDGKYATVYSHHCLEHIDNPIVALQNWWRILKRGGHLYVTVPHRDYYEKRRTLPSLFNADHRTMWLPDVFDPPNTYSLLGVTRAACPDMRLVSLRTVTTGYVLLPPTEHPRGDFHLEIVCTKP